MKAKNILIRDEKDTDYRVISDVTKSAFETIEISNRSSGRLTSAAPASSEEEQEDLFFTALAVARLKTFKPEEAVSHEEMLEKFGN